MKEKHTDLFQYIDGPNSPLLQGRFSRVGFDGPATFVADTALNLFQTFAAQKNQMIAYIENEIGKSPTKNSFLFKIGIYNRDVISESQLFVYDKLILSYFREKGYDVCIDFSHLSASHVTYPVHIKISSK